MMVPLNGRNRMLKCFHDEQGHPGSWKSIKMMRNFVTWKRMQKDVKAFVKTCHLCQTCKHRNHSYEGPYCTVVAKEKGEIVYVDILGPIIKSKLECTYVLVMVDAFTKHVRMFELRNAKTGSCLSKIMNRYIKEEGKLKG